MINYLMQVVECGGMSYPEYGYNPDPDDYYDELLDKPFDELTTDEWNFINSNSEYQSNEEDINYDNNDNEFIEF